MPISLLMPLVLSVMVLAAVVPVVLLGFYGARENTDRLLRDRSELVLDLIADRIEAHLDPVEALMQVLGSDVASGPLDPRDASAMAAWFDGALAGLPQVKFAAVIRPDGTARRYDRKTPGGTEIVDAMPPAVAAGVESARRQPGLAWFGPFWSPTIRQPALGLRVPLAAPTGEDRGVAIALVSTAELSRFLAALRADLRQTPFVLARRERVLAHPALVGLGADVDEDDAFPSLERFGDAVLARIWVGEPNPLTGTDAFRRSQGHWSWFDAEDRRSNAYVYRTLTRYGDAPWTVGFHYPGSETRRERWTVIGIGVGGTLLLVLAIATAVAVGQRLGRPMLGLADAAARIEALDFAAARRLPRGPVREVNQAAAAIERMAAGLGWFETYLPKTLVGRLMAGGARAQTTETREVTVMFTDLEGYTRYASGLPADEVVSYLNALLARVGPIIERSGGTIDKYIGDSVMAFWGAPDERLDHAADACRAALAIADELAAFNAERRAAGLHACRMRIGLHTGPVAVGNVGFDGRVDYTIIGRTVNVAQRLEQGARDVATDGETTVLVSEATASAAGSRFRFRAAGEVNDGTPALLLLGGAGADGGLS